MAKCIHHPNIEFKTFACPKCQEEIMNKYGIPYTKSTGSYTTIDEPIADEIICPEPPVASPAPVRPVPLKPTIIRDGDISRDEPMGQAVEEWVSADVVYDDDIIDDSCGTCHAISAETKDCMKLKFGKTQGIVLKSLIEKQWAHYTKTGHWPHGD